MKAIQLRSGLKLDILVGTLKVPDDAFQSFAESQHLELETILDDEKVHAMLVPVRMFRIRMNRGLARVGPVLDVSDLPIETLRMLSTFQEEPAA